MTLPWTTDNPVAPQELGLEASVIVGEVPFDDETALFKQNIGGVWSDFKMINRYENDSHRYMMGITSSVPFNNSKASFCQLAQPTLIWIVDFTVSKAGEVPEVPNPEVAGWVLLDMQLELNDTQVAADGRTPYFRISGTYFYGAINQNPNIFNNVVFPKPPYLENIPYPRTVPLGKVVTGMSDQGIVQQGGFGPFGPVRVG